jgi:16S rRNA (guanine527-N7)-methyltransferase
VALAGLLAPAPDRFLDLGSGGGVPGLVLALVWPDARGSLLDTRRRATDWLAEAVATLDLGDRVDVVAGRAEELARHPQLRGAFDLVVARGFGPPAVTAESAVGFLARDGRLAVTEPPGDHDPGRWPDVGLEQLGLSPAVRLRAAETGVAVMTARTGPLDPWPRRSGIPRKRPWWGSAAG